jgi:anti-sigma-K factor RskA
VTAACQECRDLIGGYVLDALEPDERERVRHHIEVCDACARDYAELATIPVLLEAADSADTTPLRPPPRLEEAVLDRFAWERRETAAAAAPDDAPAHGSPRARNAARPGRMRRWLVPSLAAAACAFAALIAVVVLSGGNDERSSGPATAQHQGRVFDVAMNGSGTLPLAEGDARLVPGKTGTGVRLRVTGLEPRAYNYELWCVRDDGWKISAGTFRVDASGNADVHLTTAADPREYDGLSVQARPMGAPAKAPGKRVLTGRIRS